MNHPESHLSERSRQNKEGLTLEQRAQWLLDQAATVRAAEERVRNASEELEEAKRELARFTAIHTVPLVWGLLSSEQQDELISCMPAEVGYFGLEQEEGLELNKVWLRNSGLDPRELHISN